MADEQLELRRINWNEVFSFSHIFKCFRMAIHPSKLLLAFAAIVLVCAGGWVLDNVWSTWGGYADQGEIYRHFDPGAGEQAVPFAAWKDGQNENRLRKAVDLLASTKLQARTRSNYLAKLPPVGAMRTALEAKLAEERNRDPNWQAPDAAKMFADAQKNKESWSSTLDAAGKEFAADADKLEDLVKDGADAAAKEIEKGDDKDTKKKDLETLKKHHQIAAQKLTELKRDFEVEKMGVRGRKIFNSLLHYERTCIVNAITAVRYGNITGGLNDYRARAACSAVQPIGVPSNQAIPLPAPVPADNAPGFLYWALLGVQGVSWLVAEHWLYATIFLVWCLIVWALFGGAIHRIAALHAAREEKISVSQAMKFSAGKFLSFFTAPLIPLGIIFFLGALLCAGGLIGNAWGFGAILMGVLFFLAIILGLLIAFLLIGLVTGCGLMYPTIAVEGSDSFDAISRSFSYVFAKPWRAALYSLVALVYGVICYLFVRLFAFLALKGTHFFVKWGVFSGGDTLSPDADKLDVLWTAPTFDSLHGPWSWAAMSTCEKIGSGFIWVYVFLVAGMVAAFLLTYFASSTTMIYYLLRQKVDATDLDDVYVEEAEEAPPAAPAPAPAAEAAKPAAPPGGAEAPNPTESKAPDLPKLADLPKLTELPKPGERGKSPDKPQG